MSEEIKNIEISALVFDDIAPDTQFTFIPNGNFVSADPNQNLTFVSANNLPPEIDEGKIYLIC